MLRNRKPAAAGNFGRQGGRNSAAAGEIRSDNETRQQGNPATRIPRHEGRNGQKNTTLVIRQGGTGEGTGTLRSALAFPGDGRVRVYLERETRHWNLSHGVYLDRRHLLSW